MNFIVLMRECWREDRELFIQTVVSAVALGILIPIAIIIAFVAS